MKRKPATKIPKLTPQERKQLFADLSHRMAAALAYEQPKKNAVKSKTKKTDIQ